MSHRCLCGILPIKTGASIVAGIDLLVTCLVLPTLTFNSFLLDLFQDKNSGPFVNTKYSERLGGEGLITILLLVSAISLALITIAKAVTWILLAQGIRKENDRQCKPWLWLNVILLWFVTVSFFASAVIAGIINDWKVFAIFFFILTLVVALLVYLLFVVYSYMKSVR